MVTVISRARRILRPMSHFQFFSEEGLLSTSLGLPLAEGEMPIGVYMNKPPTLRDSIVVTNFSLIIDSDGVWTPIPYARIVKALTPENKVDNSCLRIVLQDGSIIQVPVRESGHGGSDAFEIIRFLDRVIADLKGPSI